MTITKHGKKRIKERIGIPKRAQRRHIEKVLRNGLFHSRKDMQEFRVIYQSFLYLFKLDQLFQPRLITAYIISDNQLKEY